MGTQFLLGKLCMTSAVSTLALADRYSCKDVVDRAVSPLPCHVGSNEEGNCHLGQCLLALLSGRLQEQ